MQGIFKGLSADLMIIQPESMCVILPFSNSRITIRRLGFSEDFSPDTPTSSTPPHCSLLRFHQGCRICWKHCRVCSLQLTGIVWVFFN